MDLACSDGRFPTKAEGINVSTGFIHPRLHRLRVHLSSTLLGRAFHVLRGGFYKVRNRDSEAINPVIGAETPLLASYKAAQLKKE